MNYSNSILRKLFGTRAAAIYIILFALSIAVATFIENDFGTSAAQKLIFKAWWFELLLALFCGSIFMNIIWYRMIPQKRWALLTFHASIIIILIGAGITRFTGYEGVMHIREGQRANFFVSNENYIQFKAISGSNEYAMHHPILISSLGGNHFHEKYLVEGKKIHVELKRIIPNPTDSIVDSKAGSTIIKVVAAGKNGREDIFIKEGDVKRIGSEVFNFTPTPIAGTHHILRRNDSILFLPNATMTTMVMATKQTDTIGPGHGYQPIALRALHSHAGGNFVFIELYDNAELITTSTKRKITSESFVGLEFEVSIDDQIEKGLVTGRAGVPGKPQVFHFNDLDISLTYGAIFKDLPFEIALNDFEMQRYPGTNSAASYASEVTLTDPSKGLSFDYRIFMNNILTYKGYRLFQSSYDEDELGTYLSVNHDFYGTWVSYLGYALLTLGLALSLFSKKSRFQFLNKRIKEMKNSTAIAALAIASLLTISSKAQEQPTADLTFVSEAHAGQFSRLIVQDHRGRMKPVHTLTREVLRKVSGKETFNGNNADQVLLTIFANNPEWYGVPLVKIGEYTSEILGVTGKKAAYKDFFNEDGSYKLEDLVSEAFSLKAQDRNAGHKELIKVDERINITNMMFGGDLFRIIPVDGDENQTWVSGSAHNHGRNLANAQEFFRLYQLALFDALQSGNYEKPNELVQQLHEFQQKAGANVIPSNTKLDAEIFLNNFKIFNKLSLYYLFLGLFFLVLLFLSVFKHNLSLTKVVRIGLILVFIGFFFQTLGLGLRWYVSGRAPWSNGYESMIYIAWTTTLAGILFTRKSIGGLAATMILASTVLLIAMLSYLDPEITPLVPVLKSYWLTIHVSMEAGSYGFLLLGAIIGLLNLILMISANENNKQKVTRIVREMSYISEMTLIGGLIMLSIGTYLGGVWANESWGRYWGWDAKETWALVSVLVYAFILHMRLVPGLRGLFAYNLATLFGLSSVIMTYFGVNYYLSGLHSYAAGDPIPIPTWVYVLSASFVVIAILASRKRKLIEGK